MLVRKTKRERTPEQFRSQFNIKNAEKMTNIVPQQIIKGILYRGGKLMLGGGSKSFKSFALLHLAFCIANGLTWWKWMTLKGKVLFINFELFEGEAKTRLDRLKATLGQGIYENLDVANLRGKLRSVEDIEQWADVIRQEAYSLVVIDPAYKLLKGRSENAAEEIADLLIKVEAIAERANVAIAIGHHFSKGNKSLTEAIDRMSGSGVWERDPDALVIVTAHELDSCYTVETFLRSFKPVESFVVRFDFPVFAVEEDADPKALKSLRKSRNKVKYTDAMLAVPFGDNGDRELSLADWYRALHKLGFEISKQQLIRRTKGKGLDKEPK